MYFPWYAVFPVAMLALVPRTGTIVLAFIIAFMSRLIAPLVDLQPQYNPIPIAPFQVTNAGILIALVAFAVMLLWGFLRWSAREEDDEEAGTGRADLAWFLSGLDRRIGIPAVVTGIADRYTRRSFQAPSPPAEVPPSEPSPAEMPPSEIAPAQPPRAEPPADKSAAAPPPAPDPPSDRLRGPDGGS